MVPPWHKVVEAMGAVVADWHHTLPYRWTDAWTREVFERVRSIPYAFDADVWGTEVIGTPAGLLRQRALDCKKKAVLIASWAACRGIEWRFVVCRYPGESGPSHVYTEIWLPYRPHRPGYWCAMDATLPDAPRFGNVESGAAQEWRWKGRWL